MFVELMPLLAGRTVLITVAKVVDKTLRVNVIPHGKADDNPALSTPLTCTGPPEERVGHRLRLQNLAPRRRVAEVSEKIDYAAASGARQTGKTNRGNPRSWLGPALVINLVVSMAGEAYDAHEQQVQIGNSGFILV